MHLEAESKANFQTDLDDTSGVFGRVFLDPLFLLDPTCNIAVYEYCGLKERLVYESCDESIAGFSRIKQDVSFLGCLVGSVEIESKLSRSPELLKEFQKMILLLAPVLAWRQISWDKKSKLFFIFESLQKKYPHFNWIGIYRKNPTNDQELIVGPYLGEPTPHERIGLEKGICGAAVNENQSINVADVNADSRYLSCSIVTKSELVVPLRDSNGEAFAEIDIDSTLPAAFEPELQKEIETQAKHIETLLS